MTQLTQLVSLTWPFLEPVNPTRLLELLVSLMIKMKSYSKLMMMALIMVHADSIFRQTCDALEQKLATLKESLMDMEKRLCDENRHVDEQSIFYDKSLSETAAMAHALIHPSSDENDGKTQSLFLGEKKLILNSSTIFIA